ncbi:MAG: hypothetical protein E7631_10450 [Ruminococcaceae bacterium]|nr:hypothetical protein [Oscillospiraceae bacterium]
MKACVIQPPYSMDLALSDAYFAKKLELMDACDPSMDLIVLPEYSDVPCAALTREDNIACSEKYRPVLLEKAAETARRCDAVLFVNAYDLTPTGYRNTTYAFDRSGSVTGKYYKKHLPPSEQFTVALDSDYTFEPSAPYVLVIDGIRYAFLTCYDFYFYEAFAAIARENVDIIIGCSLQRSDTHEALEIMGRFLAYNTNAYVVRASVSLDGSPDICGASMIVAPTGKMLLNMKARVGLETAEFDPHEKYFKPAGFGGKPAAHYEYIEFGRHGWQYRPGGSAIVPGDRFMKYPRARSVGGYGFSGNPMAAIGAAVGLGVHEIQLDLHLTEDGFCVGSGDASVPLEAVLTKFSCHAILILRLHTDGQSVQKSVLSELHTLLHRYDCLGHCRFACRDSSLTELWQTLYPEIPTDNRKKVFADTCTEAQAALADDAEVIACENLPEILPAVQAYRK